jgi:hypothetical protein
MSKFVKAFTRNFVKSLGTPTTTHGLTTSDLAYGTLVVVATMGLASPVQRITKNLADKIVAGAAEVATDDKKPPAGS